MLEYVLQWSSVSNSLCKSLPLCSQRRKKTLTRRPLLPRNPTSPVWTSLSTIPMWILHHCPQSFNQPFVPSSRQDLTRLRSGTSKNLAEISEKPTWIIGTPRLCEQALDARSMRSSHPSLLGLRLRTGRTSKSRHVVHDDSRYYLSLATWIIRSYGMCWTTLRSRFPLDSLLIRLWMSKRTERTF